MSKRRQRTRTELSEITVPNTVHVKPAFTNWAPPSIKNFTIENFVTNKDEQVHLDTLLDKILAYMAYKNMTMDFLSQKRGKSFQGFLETMESSNISETEQSNVVYIDILDEYADNKDTILHSLSVLQDKLQVGRKLNYLGVVGDGKTYEHLHTLKIEYGADLNWLIPLPGDWHIIKNYQEVLMKVYFDVGLKDMARNAGYTEGVLNSIGACSVFKKTHLFLLRVWEAIFRVFLVNFSSKTVSSNDIYSWKLQISLNKQNN